MENSKKFVLIFPPLENFHLMKDVGQIPYWMHKKYGYDSVIVCTKNGEYPYLENEVKGLKLEFISKGMTIFGVNTSIIFWILKNAKHISVLQVYHLKRENYLYFMLYKMLNSRGITYLKLDLDIKDFKGFASDSSKNPIKKVILSKIVFSNIDVMSIETKTGIDFLIEKNPELREKLIYVPNGINKANAESVLGNVKSPEEKENIIITVGRVGSYQKNTELLLKTIEKTDLKTWKVYIIGPVEQQFQVYIKDFFERRPDLKAKVTFTGMIENKKLLYDYFNKAKIFCLVSRYESFGIVLAEALYFGNYIITTDISSATDITKDKTVGIITPQENSDVIAAELTDLINDPNKFNQKYDDIRKHSDNFVWENIVKNIHSKLAK